MIMDISHVDIGLEFNSKGIFDSHLEVTIVSRFQLCIFRKSLKSFLIRVINS